MESSVYTSAFGDTQPLISRELFQAAEQHGITRLQAQLLANRGMETLEAMQKFLHASYADTLEPLHLIDMEKALTRIQRALETREHITVYGDYDADGVTSSVLLFRALRTLKHPDAALSYHIPNRQYDGCGLNNDALTMLQKRGTTLIITTDCGSSDVAQVEYAASLGIDVIITDHHQPPALRPAAYAMVNPWRPDCTYGEHYLCGVGIAFKLTQALYRAYKRSQEDAIGLLDLVAIGTIADIAPLLGENHIFVRLGMEQLNKTTKPGLLALIRSVKLPMGRIKERDIAYALAPRINAAGRMAEASIAFELLTTDSEEDAAARVAELEQLNVTRQQITEELMRNVREQAQTQADKQIVLVHGNDWHEGIIGLVAGKLSEEINKPVLVLSNNTGTSLSRGSARSQKGFNIIAALRSYASHLERYGGHAQAAGFTIESSRIPDLHQYLLQWKEADLNGTAVAPTQIEGTELPDQTGVVTEQESAAQPAALQMIDLIFHRLERLTDEQQRYSLYKELRQLSPFGAGNPEPLFKIDKLRLLSMWASGKEGQNLRLRLGTPTSTPFGNNKPLLGTLTRGAANLKHLEGVTHVDIVFKLESSEDENKEAWVKIVEVQIAEEKIS